MKTLNAEIHGGKAEEPFICTNCKQERPAGVEGLEIEFPELGGGFGPVCIECWPLVPMGLKEFAKTVGAKGDFIKSVSEQIMARYHAAKGRAN